MTELILARRHYRYDLWQYSNWTGNPVQRKAHLTVDNQAIWMWQHRGTPDAAVEWYLWEVMQAQQQPERFIIADVRIGAGVQE